jgi:hypothetical protein
VFTDGKINFSEFSEIGVKPRIVFFQFDDYIDSGTREKNKERVAVVGFCV